MSLWADHVLPHLIERTCGRGAISAERIRWVPRAHGQVLEIGVGTGLNLPFYDPARVERVLGVEPAATLLSRAAPRARGAPVPVEFLQARAEAIPLPDSSFDSAVVSYSLCSIDDPGAALREIWRLLRPGGELFFIEHGLAPDARTRRWQRWLTPAWRRLGGGCRLDRDIFADLHGGGFQTEETSAAYIEGASWLSYTYQGVARRPGVRRG